MRELMIERILTVIEDEQLDCDVTREELEQLSDEGLLNTYDDFAQYFI